MLALKRSNAFVILLGIGFTAAGLLVSPLCRSFPTMLLRFGLVLPFGTTGLCFGIVMGAITPVLGTRRAAFVSGIVQASAGVGDALTSSFLQAISGRFGIRTAMAMLTVPFFTMIPIALWLGRVNRRAGEGHPAAAKPGSFSLSGMIRSALRERDYRLILIGFATCGFNMSIIESHLYSQYLSYGVSAGAASLTLTVYGIATMLGAMLSGFLGVRVRMKTVLGTIYAVRVVLSLAFLLAPKSVFFAFLAAALLGLTGDATVPPTSGIISRQFGAERMAVLYGFALIGHQVGAFFSAWLGGVFVALGWGYSPLWLVNLCLAALAAAASYAIRQR